MTKGNYRKEKEITKTAKVQSGRQKWQTGAEGKSVMERMGGSGSTKSFVQCEKFKSSALLKLRSSFFYGVTENEKNMIVQLCQSEY